MKFPFKKQIISLQDKWRFFWTSAKIRLAYRIGQRRFPQLRKKGIPHAIHLGVVGISGNEKSGIILPPNYLQIVEEFYQDAKQRFAQTKNCRLRSASDDVNKKIALGNLPEKLDDVEEIQKGLISTVRLAYTLDLKNLQEICNILLPQVEENIYHSPIIVEKVTVYRHLTSALPEYASILWHADNHFEEVTKIMIYLSDVGEKQAPFEYLRHKETGGVIHIQPAMPQKYPSGRIPKEVIDNALQNGYESYKVLGPKGTTMIFDDKIIHKGNYAKEGYRDVLVLQLRPVAKAYPRYLDPAWTTSF